LPGASFLNGPGVPPADYAVVWAPPQQFFDEQPQLKAVFNIGAGVDKLLQAAPAARAKIVRLDDAGMAVQMAEYVCHALIRHYREFDAMSSRRAPANGRSASRARSRADFPVGIMGLGVLGQRVAQAVAQFEFPVQRLEPLAHQVAFRGRALDSRAPDGTTMRSWVPPAGCWSVCCR
jgi:glyoxylate/hydroxypyruvate reductase A